MPKRMLLRTKMCPKQPNIWFNRHQQWATSKIPGQDLSIHPLFWL